jgi:hypothetical protein
MSFKKGALLTPGDKSLYILWVDGECLVEALERLDGGARLEVLDALVHVLEGPVARLLAPQLTRAPVSRELALKKNRPGGRFSFFLIFLGGFFLFVLYSALLHLPPLRFHCADGCWDCNWCIGS